MEALDLNDPTFWVSEKSRVLTNPRDREALHEAELISPWLKQQLDLKAHVLFRTSGSTGPGKWVALAKEALLASARSVNNFLEVTSEDRWLQTLPLFHVGGIGIAARAYLADCRVIGNYGKWDPAGCYKQLNEEGVTHTSFVPTQLADLVKLHLPAPSSVRAVLIGGGVLHDELYQQAVTLGWPVRETYGMTETASQVATALAGERCLRVLPCWQVQTTDKGEIEIAGKPLLSAYVGINKEGQCFLEDPKKNGWLTSNDLGHVSGDHLTIQGRADRCVKILGELIDLIDVENAVGKSFRKADRPLAEYAVVAIDDARAGHQLILCIQKGDGIQGVLDLHHTSCHPLHRIRKVIKLAELPRTAIGKINYHELTKQIIGSKQLK